MIRRASSPRERRLAAALSIVLVAAVLAVFAGVGGHEYLAYDDDEAITGNAGLSQGLSSDGVAWAFRTTLVANWIPVTVLSLLADQELHGLSARFVLIENVALHALATLLLFFAFRRLTGTLWRSAAVAAVFAIHPLHVESVAWAAMRKDVLSGVFFAATLLAYARAVERPSLLRHGWVSASLAAGLLSKPTLVTTPFVLLLLDFWPLGRLAGDDGRFDPKRGGRALLEKLPLFALAAASSIATLFAQRSAGAVVAANRLALGQRIANAIVASADYLATSVWPAGLAVFYPAEVDGWGISRVAISAAVLLAITALCIVERRRRPWLLVGWLWFLGMLVPTLGLVQVGSQARADRYTYLPLIGLSILPIWTLAEIASRRPTLRRPLAVTSLVALVALGSVAHRQVGYWRDGATLFARARDVTRDNALTRSFLAEALLAAGRHGEAADEMRAALRLRPDYLEMKNNLAWVLATNPEIPLADPGEPFRLAVGAVEATGGRNPQTLYTLARVFERDGRFAEAERTARRAANLARSLGAEAFALEIEAKADELRGRTPDPKSGARRSEPGAAQGGSSLP
ncbi:hypothetical protein MYXO_01101 [Myxococcaceae bacterium]|nr:hypothetical protein MYXO_01101 [Myxococcaceae bacterium]